MVNLREWALPVYTIMMQMSAGSMLALWVLYTVALRRYGPEIATKLTKNPLIVIVVTVITAMIGSHYHLSRPAFSLFAVLNFQSSWLSREVGFTVVFAGLAGLLLLVLLYRPSGQRPTGARLGRGDDGRGHGLCDVTGVFAAHSDRVEFRSPRRSRFSVRWCCWASSAWRSSC
ncbi:MAG: dimethyl sulfoxide reductase anchor subunit [Chloroflexi bacterium]|uniref:DmsC/YnfH family molybdoenzyme membrane anchor subunit n=1 Tax=Candidatus Flexifilum breve TaxID=3140694 RepID=UPI003135F2F2|nr:dimethyl sulfoxide reductase anchor subunit [Chloroflexota bacterium]